MAAHALCFPLSLVSTGSFSSKKKKWWGGSRLLWGRTETQGLQVLCCTGLQRMSPFWPGAPEPPAGRLPALWWASPWSAAGGGRGPGPAHQHVGAARPPELCHLFPPCRLRDLPCGLLLPRQRPSPLSQSQAPPSRSGTEPQRSPDVPSCDWRAPGAPLGEVRRARPLSALAGRGGRLPLGCLARWPVLKPSQVLPHL